MIIELVLWGFFGLGIYLSIKNTSGSWIVLAAALISEILGLMP